MGLQPTNSFELKSAVLTNHMSLVQHNSEPSNLLQGVLAFLSFPTRTEFVRYGAVRCNYEIECCEPCWVLDSVGAMVDMVSKRVRPDMLLDLFFPVRYRAERTDEQSRPCVLNQRR